MSEKAFSKDWLYPYKEVRPYIFFLPKDDYSFVLGMSCKTVTFHKDVHIKVEVNSK